jgi:hypothetical protein
MEDFVEGAAMEGRFVILAIKDDRKDNVGRAV